MKKLYKLLSFITIISTLVIVMSACNNENDQVNAENEQSSKKIVTPDDKGTVEEDGFLKYRSTEWSDEYEGLKLRVNSVSLGLEDKGVYIWISEENTSDRSFSINTSTSKIVTDDGTQYEVDFVNSDRIGGDLVAGAKRDGDLVFDTDYENIRDLSEIRLIFSITDSANYKSKEYDIKLNLDKGE